MKRSGTADLPLHGGRVPAWLAERMTTLGTAIAESVVHHYGASELLSRLGLGSRLTHRPAELSGGERQRVAVARAIANRPLLLLADEPTGNLDPRTAETVHEEFVRLIRDEGLGALIATHNIDLARRMKRIVRLENGTLVEDRP